MKPNLLELIPVRNPKFEWRADEKQLVTIYVENKGIANKAAQIFFKKPKVSQIHLDEMGSLVWRSIDGSMTVLEMAEAVGTGYEQLAVYLKLLERQKFVTFVNKNP